MTGRDKSQFLKHHCLLCGGVAIRKDWIRMDVLNSVLVYRCEDVYCNHVFLVKLVIEVTHKPAKVTNWQVNLPLSPPVRKKLLKKLKQNGCIDTFYPVAIKHDEDNHTYKMVLPTIEDCYAYANTLENALKYARNFMCIHLWLLVDAGKPIPLPTTIENHCFKPEFEGFEWHIIDISQYDSIVNW